MNETRGKITIISSLVLLIILAFGATYAYFIHQIEEGTNTNIDVSIKKTDSLVYQTDGDFYFSVDQESFAPGKPNADGNVDLYVKLVANNDNYNATYKYHVNLEVLNNSFKYTQGNDIPELILTVTKPDGKILSDKLPELNYVEIKSGKDDGVVIKGYDVTNFDSTVELTSYIINASPNSKPKGEASQKWDFNLTFINLNDDQSNNAGSDITAKITLETEKID